MTPPALLHYVAPARRWTDALPVGNGTLGAMCFAGVDQDRIQLNDGSCWSGSPASSAGRPLIAPGGGPRVLAEVRAALAAGDVVEAERLMRTLQHGHSQSYQPLADLWLDTTPQEDGPTSDYRRQLDLDEAVAAHTWTRGATRIRQETFVSRPAGAVVVRRWVDGPGTLDLTVRLTSPHPTAWTETGPDGVLVGARMPSEVVPPHEPADVPVVYDPRPGASMTALAAVRVRTDGVVAPTADSVVVSGAREIVLLVSSVTDVEERGAAPHGRVDLLRSRLADRLAALDDVPVGTLRAEHVADHAALFGRVVLDLGHDPDRAALPTDERVRRFAQDGTDPGLAALVFAYGRYLMVAGSRPGGLPLTLQGLWNERTRPVWSSNYTTNINVQMSYWPAESANLAECAEPFHAWITRLADGGARVAAEVYGMDGWAAHHNSDAWGFALPAGEGDGNPSWSAWPMAGAWLSLHLWEHYAFTGDRDYLQEAWPVLRGAALFGLDWLVPSADGAQVGTSPSTSPENTYLLPDGRSAALSVSTTSDVALLRGLFTHCLEAMRELDDDDGLGDRLRDALDRLPGYRIMPDGRLAEWSTDVADAEPAHRHHSHLIGVHPGTGIDPDRTPVLAAAARASLAARGPRTTGWSLAWRLSLHARLRDSASAFATVRSFLAPMADDASEEPSMTAPAGIYRNLFCAHPPVQLDGNLGFTAGVVEMLLQSHADEVHLLPSLPAQWPDGSVRGLRARGAVTVDVSWRAGSLTGARLVADRDRSVTVRVGAHHVALDLRAGQPVRLDASLAVEGALL